MESVIGQQRINHRRKPLKIVPGRYGFVAQALNGKLGSGSGSRAAARARPAAFTGTDRADGATRDGNPPRPSLIQAAGSIRDREEAGREKRRWKLRLPGMAPVLAVAGSVLILGTFASLGAMERGPRLEGFTLPDDGMSAGVLLASISPMPPALDESAAMPELPVTVSLSSYTVAARDTLDSISRRFGVRLDTLISLNGITDVRRLRTGTVLKIPSIDGIAHVVTRGESLGGIASSAGVEVLDLVDANDLSSQVIHPGQTLFIPGARLSSYDLKKALGTLVIWPASGRISSRFGYRPNPFTGVRQFHTGLDIVAAANSPAKAAMDGRVAETGYSAIYGNFVILSHAGGYQTLYAHLNKILVKTGASVSQGGTVGLVGNTGYSTATHLHFGVFKGGSPMDPQKFLP